MSLLKRIFKKENQAKSEGKKAVLSSVEKKPEQKKTEKSEKAKKKESRAAIESSKGNDRKNYAHHLNGIIRPLVTEKSAQLSSLNKYIFEVAPSLNKIEIRKAIRDIYGVDAENVHIVNVAGKHVRFGRIFGKTKNWKKAYVTLKEGDTIEIYEGV